MAVPLLRRLLVRAGKMMCRVIAAEQAGGCPKLLFRFKLASLQQGLLDFGLPRRNATSTHALAKGAPRTVQ